MLTTGHLDDADLEALLDEAARAHAVPDDGPARVLAAAGTAPRAARAPRRRLAVAGGLVAVGDVVCPSACCCECVSVGECEIVDDGDSGPMFVTNSGPMLGGGIGDPGGSGAELGVRDSKKPGALRFAFGSSGVSLVSRECVWRFESDAKGSSPTSDVVLPLPLPKCPPCAPRNALGGCGCGWIIRGI